MPNWRQAGLHAPCSIVASARRRGGVRSKTRSSRNTNGCSGVCPDPLLRIYYYFVRIQSRPATPRTSARILWGRRGMLNENHVRQNFRLGEATFQTSSPPLNGRPSLSDFSDIESPAKRSTFSQRLQTSSPPLNGRLSLNDF